MSIRLTRIFKYFAFTCMVLLFLTGVDVFAQSRVEEQLPKSYENIPEFADKLIKSYPDQKLRYENNFIVFSNGKRIVFDDRQDKSFESMLNDADIEDMFKITYRTDGEEPHYLEDSGRIRCEAFFKMMYGSNANEVRKNLVSLSWFGQKIKFSSVNGAADALRQVANDIQTNHPELVK